MIRPRRPWLSASGAIIPAMIAVAAMTAATTWTELAVVIGARFSGAAIFHHTHRQPRRPRTLATAGIILQSVTLISVVAATTIITLSLLGWVIISAAAGISAQLVSRPLVAASSRHLDHRSSIRTAIARTLGAVCVLHPAAMAAVGLSAITATLGLRPHLPTINHPTSTNINTRSTPRHHTHSPLPIVAGATTLFAPYLAVWNSTSGAAGFASIYLGAIVGAIIGSHHRIRIHDGDPVGRWNPPLSWWATLGLVAVGFAMFHPASILMSAFVAGLAGEVAKLRLFAHTDNAGWWHLWGSAAGGPAGWALITLIGPIAPMVLAGIGCGTVLLSDRHRR